MATTTTDTTVLAEVPCQPGRRLHFEWGVGAELLLADVAQASTPAASPSSTTLLSWGFAGPLRRRVIFDTLPKYTALKRDAIQGGQPLVQYCNTVERLLDAAANAPYVDVSVPEAGLHRHQNTRADDDGEGAVLAAERVVWQLLHVFFVSQGRVIGSIAQDLAYWLFTNAGLLCGGFTAEDAVRQASAATIPEDDPSYWLAVQRCVALGWLVPAADLIGLHTAWQRVQLGASADDAALAGQLQVLEALLILLRRMPALAAPGGAGEGLRRMAAAAGEGAAGEFVQKRARWQATCRQLLDDDDAWAACRAASPPTAAGCRVVVSLLLGDQAALATCTSTWLELLVATLVHVHPMAKPQTELRALLAQCQANTSDGSAAPEVAVYLEPLSTLLPLAADADVQGLVATLSNMFGDWFMAHAVDLLAATSSVARALLTAPLPQRGGSQAELYLLDYAATLMPLSSGWQVACEYLQWCPAHGAAATRALLAALPVTAPDHRLLPGATMAAARRWGCGDLVPGVWRSVGACAWLEGRVGEALAAVAAARDGSAVGGVVVRGVVEAVRAALLVGDGRVPVRVLEQLNILRPLLDALAADAAPSPLLLLRRMADLLDSLRALEGARGPQAAAVGTTVKQCLLAVLQSADASLAVAAVFAALPLLETQGGLLSWQEVHAVMGAVHGGGGGAMQQSVRLALVRSLARAAC